MCEEHLDEPIIGQRWRDVYVLSYRGKVIGNREGIGKGIAYAFREKRRLSPTGEVALTSPDKTPRCALLPLTSITTHQRSFKMPTIPPIYLRATTLAAVVAVGVEPRMGVMGAILLVSLFAVSFPTISKQVPSLRIPGILFFIGKHFGTGVILATAFIHLLDDAFRSLQNPVLERWYGKVGKWTGLIILTSLLSIFLVEYVSTTYVEHLQDKPSAPPTPVDTPPTSPKPRTRSISRTRRRSRSRPLSPGSPPRSPRFPTLPPSMAATESTPLLIAAQPVPSGPKRSASLHFHPAHTFPVHHHHHHHLHHVFAQAKAVVGLPLEVLAGSPRICRLGLAQGRTRTHGRDCQHVLGPDSDSESSEESGLDEVEGSRGRRHSHEERQHHHRPVVGRRRQIVGVLVLQLGIMIHSLVIGLTLAVTSGSDFTSLTTAIIFHQLFEGLSLGIRIAALPPSTSKHGHGHSHEHEREHHYRHSGHDLEDVEEEPRGRSASSGSDREEARKARAAREQLAVNGGTLVHSPTQEESSSPRSPLLGASTKTRPRPPREPLPSNTGFWAALKRVLDVRCWGIWQKDIHWLQPTLSLLFAVTTPFGMGVGMMLWGGEKGKSDEAQMLLIQGVMSAISAGLLIYAATVEMIAGDFVYGDVDGHSHHHHGHGGPVDSQHVHHHHHSHDSSVDSMPGDVESLPSPSGPAPPPVLEKKAESTMMKRALAVASLFAGATMMVLVGLGE
ncbi:unnamed protein product [Cyclocybe aegerita]|uniref:Zinc/iron permease n=1 Tax=Cyclocybe aegerita TaxID=1973307 RepID=A0A8S0X1W3_CYCAE|nr:unnamed protein product [Cyclocybe aegerita]